MGMDNEAEGIASRIRSEKEEATLQRKSEFLRKINSVKLEVRANLRGHLSKVYALDWCTDSRLLVSASQDGKLIVWDTHKMFKLYLIPLRSAWVMTCAYAPSGGFVACGGLDNIISLYYLKNRDGTVRLIREFFGHKAFVASCQFLEDKYLLSSSGDKSCILWDLETGRKLTTFEGHEGGVMSISIQDPTNSNLFVSGSCDCTAKLWDIRDQKCIGSFSGHNSDINAVKFFPSNTAFATGSDDSTCKLYDIRLKDELATYSTNDGKESSVTSLAFSNSGRMLFVGSDDYNCNVWDSMRQELIGVLVGHENRISCLGVSKDGIKVATGSWDSLLKIWN